MITELTTSWEQSFGQSVGQVLIAWGEYRYEGPMLHLFGFAKPAGAAEQYFYRTVSVLGEQVWTIDLPDASQAKGVAGLNQRSAEAFMLINQYMGDAGQRPLFNSIPRCVVFYPDQDFMPVAFWLLRNNPGLLACDWGREMAHIKAFGVDWWLRAAADAGQLDASAMPTEQAAPELNDSVFEQWLIHLLDRQHQPALMLQLAQAWLTKSAELDAAYIDALKARDRYFDLPSVAQSLDRLNLSIWPKDILTALQQPLQ